MLIKNCPCKIESNKKLSDFHYQLGFSKEGGEALKKN